jgi:GNAT superfamily N-acetyltransferase
LHKSQFSRDSLARVQSFECGSETWAIEVSDWIKADEEGAADSVDKGTCTVWLYYTDGEEMLGYASLGLSFREWNVPGYPRSKIPIIPFFGVRSEFQGQPRSAHPLDRYGARMMRDIVAEAMHLGGTDLPLLGLLCDHRNSKAIAFYERLGYVLLDPVDGGRERVRMIVRLPVPIELT